MKIGYLGGGAWGFTLATLLAQNGHTLTLWNIEKPVVDALNRGEEHPRLKGLKKHENITLTLDLEEALSGAEILVESVTSAGFRSVLEQMGRLDVPLVLTSKGIEQGTGLLLSEVAAEVLGEEVRPKLGCISGPTIAQEVMQHLPAAVVCSSYNLELIPVIQKMFATPYFQVYPNRDMRGVSFGGAMKNIVAIACGISDGMGYGQNTKAALMTRGLHEMKKLAPAKGANPETLMGLSGMGDLCVTCLSVLSRNYIFGRHLAKGQGAAEAKNEIGMVVEGAYTCVSALELAKKENVVMPITEVVHGIIYEGEDPKASIEALLSAEVEEEHV